MFHTIQHHLIVLVLQRFELSTRNVVWKNLYEQSTIVYKEMYNKNF